MCGCRRCLWWVERGSPSILQSTKRCHTNAGHRTPCIMSSISAWQERVGHFFGFSKTKNAKIRNLHFSEKNKKHQPSSTKICPKRSNDILYYQTTKCPQFYQVSMHGSPHQVHDATVGATSQDGPKMMGLGYPVDSGLRYGHFWYLYVSVRFLGCNKKVPPMFWIVLTCLKKNSWNILWIARSSLFCSLRTKIRK